MRPPRSRPRLRDLRRLDCHETREAMRRLPTWAATSRDLGPDRRAPPGATVDLMATRYCAGVSDAASQPGGARGAEPAVAHRVVPPPLPALVLARERLVSKALGTPPGGCCLLAVAPGTGATTLLALAAAASGAPTGWLSLDGRHADARHFWRHVLTALAQVGVAVDDAERSVRRLGTAREDRFFEVLRDALAGQRTDVLLVLDDLHSVTHRPVAGSLLRWLEDLPPGIRVLLRWRGAVPWDLSRLASGGRLVLLGQEDLLLSAQEASALARRGAPGLGADRSEALVSLADGWAAALVAATTNAGTDADDDPAAWLMATGVDLLARPEYDRLDPGLRDFLVQTSVLDRLTAVACDAVRRATGAAADGEAMLDRLRAARTLCVVPDPGRGEVRLLPLLRELLRRRLADRGPDAEVRAHRAAAGWFASQDRVEEAITEYFTCGDVPDALTMLERHLGPLLDGGRFATVRAWYRSAPEAYVRERQLHLLAAAWAELLNGDAVASLDRLHDLQDELVLDPEQGDPTPDWLRADAELLSAYLAGWQGRPAQLRQHVAAARASYGDAWYRTAHQVAAFLEIRGRLWTGDTAAARPLLVSVASRPRTRSSYRHVALRSLQALLAAWEGRAHRALQLASEALDWLEDNGTTGPVDRCDALLAKALAGADLLSTSTAATCANELLGQARALGHLTYEALALVALARNAGVEQGLGHLAEARRLLRQRAPGSDLMVLVDRSQARLLVEAGDHAAAVRAVSTTLLPDDPDRVLAEAAALSQRRPAEALRRIRVLTPRTPRQAAETRLLVASCLAETRPDEAQAQLRAVTDIAEEHGLGRLLTPGGERLATLVDRACDQESRPALLELRAHLRATARHAAGASRPPCSSAPESFNWFSSSGRAGATPTSPPSSASRSTPSRHGCADSTASWASTGAGRRWTGPPVFGRPCCPGSETPRAEPGG